MFVAIKISSSLVMITNVSMGDNIFSERIAMVKWFTLSFSVIVFHD